MGIRVHRAPWTAFLRNNPFFSPFGLIATVLLLSGLAAVVWRSGGRAFSPGRLSGLVKPGVQPGGFSSHAEFEGECRRCHLPLETTQDRLCLDCHSEIAAQIESEAGTHAMIRAVTRCAACHSDHQGHDFDPTRSAYAHFDHSATSFLLARHQVDYDTQPIDCTACHLEEPEFSTSLEGCVSCHALKDFEFMQQHSVDFGFECLLCHDGSDVISAFDHQTSAFPLNGKHAQILCSECHTQVKPGSNPGLAREDILPAFRQTPSRCSACHQEPELHRGVFTQSCNVCHGPLAWLPATLEGDPFDHHSQAGFSLQKHKLDYRAQAISCRACHPVNIYAFETEQCIACHQQGQANPSFMQEHLAQYGPACLGCHDGVDRMRMFRHADRFPLQGKHAELACQDCHAEGRYMGTPSACVSCHAEPAIHAGFFGLKCQYCHSDSAWSPAQLQIHNFPVGHGDQDGSDCKTCHLDRYDAYTCYECHDHQPGPILESHLRAGIAVDMLPACADCHPDGQVVERP